MSDLIERQAAIDAILAVTGNSSVRELYEHVQEHGLSEMWSGGVNAAIDTIIAVPSAQPERLTDDDFETIRIHLNAIKEKLCNQHRWEEAEEYQRIIDRFMRFASAQPERKKTRMIVKSNGKTNYYVCEKCDEPLDPRDNYCPNCGDMIER